MLPSFHKNHPGDKDDAIADFRKGLYPRPTIDEKGARADQTAACPRCSMALFAVATVFLAVAIAYPWVTTSELSAWLPLSALCLVVSTGLFLRQLWSQHLIFGIAVSYSVQWPVTVAAIAWTGWPYADPVESVISLVPGLLWVGFWIGMYLPVRAQFKHKHARSALPGIFN